MQSQIKLSQIGAGSTTAEVQGVSNRKIPKAGLGYSEKMHYSIACAATEAGSSLTI